MPGYDSGWAFANAVTLTALLGVVAFLVWRRRGAVSGLRWVGVALLPVAAYLVGLLRTFWVMAEELTRFFSALVWSPRVWLGLGLAVLAALLIVLPGRAARSLGAADPDSANADSTRRGRRSTTGQPRKPTQGDDDMADIEAILKRRGIT